MRPYTTMCFLRVAGAAIPQCAPQAVPAAEPCPPPTGRGRVACSAAHTAATAARSQPSSACTPCQAAQRLAYLQAGIALCPRPCSICGVTWRAD